ncbi:MAG: hypothetical protein ACYC8S_03525 [Minisyncoccota bacterium]
MKISKQHQLVRSLKPGDMIHVMHTCRGKATLFFCAVLEIEEDSAGEKQLFLSLLDSDKPIPVSSSFNPYHWDEKKQAIVDRDGDIFASKEEFVGIEREGAAETAKIYSQIPRRKDVRVHVTDADIALLCRDPLSEVIIHILGTEEAKTIPEMVSLVLDKLNMPHSPHQLGLISLLVGVIVQSNIGMVIKEHTTETIKRTCDHAGHTVH